MGRRACLRVCDCVYDCVYDCTHDCVCERLCVCMCLCARQWVCVRASVSVFVHACVRFLVILSRCHLTGVFKTKDMERQSKQQTEENYSFDTPFKI